jgi:anti-anti-sigma regulatory factor
VGRGVLKRCKLIVKSQRSLGTPPFIRLTAKGLAMHERSSSACIAIDPGMLPCWWRMVVRTDGVHLLVGGELDLASADLLDEALRQLEIFPLTSHIDLSALTFADTAGLEPLADSARRRDRNSLPPLDITGASRRVHQILDLLHGGRAVTISGASPEEGGAEMRIVPPLRKETRVRDQAAAAQPHAR